jgi:hypothetical protein
VQAVEEVERRSRATSHELGVERDARERDEHPHAKLVVRAHLFQRLLAAELRVPSGSVHPVDVRSKLERSRSKRTTRLVGEHAVEKSHGGSVVARARKGSGELDPAACRTGGIVFGREPRSKLEELRSDFRSASPLRETGGLFETGGDRFVRRVACESEMTSTFLPAGDDLREPAMHLTTPRRQDGRCQDVADERMREANAIAPDLHELGLARALQALLRKRANGSLHETDHGVREQRRREHRLSGVL